MIEEPLSGVELLQTHRTMVQISNIASPYAATLMLLKTVQTESLKGVKAFTTDVATMMGAHERRISASAGNFSIVEPIRTVEVRNSGLSKGIDSALKHARVLKNRELPLPDGKLVASSKFGL